jgi:hypothetical protein
MKRLLLAVLILYGATVAFPGLGDRAQPKMDAAWDWTWDRMEGPLSPVTNRYRRARANSELSKMARHLVMQRNQGGRAPTEETLSAFLTRNEIAPGGLDPWGTPYRLTHERGVLTIRSAGPDLRYETEDDLLVDLPFPHRGPR